MTTRVGNKGAAAIAGITPSAWRAYVARHDAPPPDGREPISGTPWWFEGTIRRWMRARPGQGARTDKMSA